MLGVLQRGLAVAARARPPPVLLTKPAVSRLSTLLGGKTNVTGVKLSVAEQKGCAGNKYVMDYCDTPGKLDEVVEQDGVKLVIDARALFKLIGTTIDFIDTPERTEFVFENPNAESTCGCGESFYTA